MSLPRIYDPSVPIFASMLAGVGVLLLIAGIRHAVRLRRGTLLRAPTAVIPVAIAGIGAVALALGSWEGREYLKYRRMVSAFEEAQVAADACPGDAGDELPLDKQSGRMAVIAKSTGTLHSAHFELDPSVRADSPGQAAFLACVDEASMIVGHYGGKLASPGTARAVVVRVVEWRSGAVSRPASLYYSPPDSIRVVANRRTEPVGGYVSDIDMIPVDIAVWLERWHEGDPSAPVTSTKGVPSHAAARRRAHARAWGWPWG